MKRLHWLAILMTVAILGISGFQVYWLSQNYGREKKSLAIKTDQGFRETITHLQVAKLKLDGINWGGDAEKPDVRIFVSGKDPKSLRIPVPPKKEEIVSTINVIRDKVNMKVDSIRKEKSRGVVISMNESTVDIHGHGDTMKYTRRIPNPEDGKDYIFDLLYGVDSLQDSIKVSEINQAYSAHLKRQKLEVPFTVTRIDSANRRELPRMNCVTVGFARPITYKLTLGNTFPYLIRQIMQPILFSILLLGVTILSFVLLYRNLLKQQRLAELKNEFISNITHELKTPIATVGVAIEALRNFNAIHDPERTKEYLDISSNELQRLGLLVDKVLKLSMFEKKEIDLKYEPVDLHALVQEVVASLKLQIEKYKASVSVTQEGDVHMRGDRLHLVSVIFNLLDNALKYSKEGATIRIVTSRKDDWVSLTVSDNGIGVPEEYREKIFEKFFRVPHGDTHNAKGYGLGLSYVAQVVRKHKGEITVESETGTGATFTIRFPVNSNTTA